MAGQRFINLGQYSGSVVNSYTKLVMRAEAISTYFDAPSLRNTLIELLFTQLCSNTTSLEVIEAVFEQLNKVWLYSNSKLSF